MPASARGRAESITGLGIDNDIHAAFARWSWADQNQNSSNVTFYFQPNGPFRVFAQTVLNSSCDFGKAADTDKLGGLDSSNLVQGNGDVLAGSADVSPGFFGYTVSGVYSNADLAANLAGLKFYQNLSNDVDLGGTKVTAILKIVDGKWQLTGTQAPSPATPVPPA